MQTPLLKRKVPNYNYGQSESLSGKFRYRKTNIPILSRSNFFDKQISKSNPDPKNHEYPAGYPLLILSMIISARYTVVFVTSHVNDNMISYIFMSANQRFGEVC